MLYSVLTTINKPTHQVEVLANVHKEKGLGKIIIVGDQKGPFHYDLHQTKLLTIENQLELFPNFADALPKNHYSRKNIGYLMAMKEGASCIYETDDDNKPNSSWVEREVEVKGCKKVRSKKGWVNIYQYFTSEHIWPRGLPLNQILNNAIPLAESENNVHCPIQQGLVNNSPDVDAIWRLTLDRPFNFDPNVNDSVMVPRGVWSPFNTQSTWWWPMVYPLLYIPSYSSFRMCDIWKSFVAQRCLWELDCGVVFHPAEVVQDRNPHNIMRDFEDEIPGYSFNEKIVDCLASLELDSGVNNVMSNLIKCYESMVQEGFLPDEEMILVEAWKNEIDALNNK